MLNSHEFLTSAETRLITTIQKQLIEGLRISGEFLSEEEIAYCLKVALEQERLRLVIHYL